MFIYLITLIFQRDLETYLNSMGQVYGITPPGTQAVRRVSDHHQIDHFDVEVSTAVFGLFMLPDFMLLRLTISVLAILGRWLAIAGVKKVVV